MPFYIRAGTHIVLFTVNCISWSVPLIKEAGDVLLKAEGYTTQFTYSRALYSASMNLLDCINRW
jgi:hypothetical protein